MLAIIEGIQPVYMSDFQAFAVAGRRLLSSDWASVFDFDRIQVGPLHLLFNGLIDLISDIFVIDHQVVLSLVVQVGFVLCLIFAARALGGLAGARLSPIAEVALAGASIAMTMPWTLYLTGHAAEGFIPLLWLFAAIDASRDRQERAGLLLAASALLKAWGILGLPLLLFGVKRERWWRGAAVTVGVCLLVYAPFFIFGEVNTFGYHWTTTSTATITGLFVDRGEPFTWGMRILQAVATLAVGTGGVVLAKRKGSFHALWAVPLAMTGMRLLIDPIADWYHWIPAQTFALIGMVLLISMSRTVVSYLVAAGGYPLFLTWTSGPNGAWALGLGLVATLINDPAREKQNVPSEAGPVLPPVSTPV